MPKTYVNGDVASGLFLRKNMRLNASVGHSVTVTLHPRIGPVFFGLMNVRLSVGLVFVENGPLFVRKINRERDNVKDYLPEGSK